MFVKKYANGDIFSIFARVSIAKLWISSVKNHEFCCRMGSRLKKVLLSTAYLPPVEYLTVLCCSEKCFIELHETYQRQSWRNRCRIISANGPMNLIIPVSRPAGNHTKTKDVLISHHENWQKQHWQSIRSAYSNAPYFLYYKDLLEPFYKTGPDQHLWQFNHELLECIIKEIDLPVKIEFTTGFIKNPEDRIDLRHVLTPKTHRRKEAVVSRWESYYQVFQGRHGFIPNLSILDLLFHTGPDTLPYLKDSAEQITFLSK